MRKNAINYFFGKLLPCIAILMLLQAIQAKAADPGQSCDCFDGTFATVDWTDLMIKDANGSGQYQVLQMSAGGNLNEYRRTRHDYGYGEIYVAHKNTKCTYDPKIQGAIDSVSYRFDLLQFDPPVGQDVAYRLLVFQDQTYYGGPLEVIGNQSVWTNKPSAIVPLKPGDFIKIAGPSSTPLTPNFTAAGKPITFGYLSGNNNPNPSTKSTRISGLDNWCVNIVSVPPPTDPCCPPWDVNRLKSMMFYKGQGSISAPYVLQFKPTSTFINQMQAYINYLNFDPTIKRIVIYWDLRDQGTGTNPNPNLNPTKIFDPTAGTGQGQGYVKWDAPNTNGYGVLDPNYFLLEQPNAVEYPMQVGTWYVIHTYIYLNDKIRYWPEKCDTNDIYVRIQVQPQMPRNSGSQTILEFSDGKKVIQRVPIQVQN